MTKSVEWQLQPSLVLPSMFLGINLMALLLILTLSMPLALQLVFGSVVLGSMFGLRRVRKNHGLCFGYGIDGWWLEDQAQTVSLKKWQQYGSLLLLQFDGRPAIIISRDMLEPAELRELLQRLRYSQVD